QKRPTDCTGTEVGHVLILGQPVDGFLQDALIAPKDGPVTGQEEVRVVLKNAFEGMNEVRNVRTVVGIDNADAAVLIDVVADKEQLAHAETELPGGVAGRVPDL